MFQNITNEITNKIAMQLVEAVTPTVNTEVQKLLVNLTPLIEKEIANIADVLINEIQTLEPIIESETQKIITALTPVIQKEITNVGNQIIAQLKTMKS